MRVKNSKTCFSFLQGYMTHIRKWQLVLVNKFNKCDYQNHLIFDLCVFFYFLLVMILGLFSFLLSLIFIFVFDFVLSLYVDILFF
jgi:hypothetical protein